jgi:1,4-alpha-glucan branching enzyme
VGFHLNAPAAKSVKLAADFTDWEKAPVKLTRRADGVWLTALPLAPGDYAYRFIVDGQWCDDPSCMRRVANPFGTTNAVVSVS